MYRLFLDDERKPSDVKWVELPLGPWTIVKNYQQFTEVVETQGVPDFVSFDHDLAEEHYRPSMYNPDKHYTNYYTDGTFKEKTGFTCAQFLLNYCINSQIKFPEYVVHSMNPIGRENIKSYIESAKKHFDFL